MKNNIIKIKLYSIIFILISLFSKLAFSTNCEINQCSNFPNVIEIEGIEFPLSLAQKKKKMKPTKGKYYIYHWKPKDLKPSPYIIMLPSSGGITTGSSKTYYRYTEKLLKRGFGIIIIDIFYNTDVKKGTVSRGPIQTMAALSALDFVNDRFSNLSNGKFGVLGESRGAMNVLSLASNTIRNNHLYKNVDKWFDAGVALYPSCSQITLTMPVKIFIGELDEWVSAAGCRSWEKTDIKQIDSGLLDITIYKNTHHLFNRETMKTLQRSSSKDHDLGGRAMLYNKQADLDSEKKIIEFFKNKLKTP